MRRKAKRLAAIALVLLVTGCGGTKSSNTTAQPDYPPIPSDVPAAIRKQLENLHSPDPQQRAHAVVVLGRTGKQSTSAVPHLLTALKDGHPQVRQNAAETLGAVGARQAVEPLIAILEDTDEDWGVRSRAAESLGKLRARRATEPLIAALADMVSHVRQMAASALGEIGDPAAQEALAGTAQYDSDETVRNAAKDSLRKIGSVPGGP